MLNPQIIAVEIFVSSEFGTEPKSIPTLVGVVVLWEGSSEMSEVSVLVSGREHKRNGAGGAEKG